MSKVKIQIIGAGIVGKAFGKTLKSLGYEVYLKDLDSGVFKKEADIFFICTREEDVYLVLKEYFPEDFKKPIVIRSTLTPGDYSFIKTCFPKLHLSTNPEFLRQKTAEEDSLHPEFQVIGECCSEHGKLIFEILRSLNCPIVRTKPEKALMIKLAHNAFLTTLISFWNEIAKISPELDPQFIAQACSMSKRIPEYGTKVVNSPFAGKCLPKDLDQLIAYASNKGINPVLLKAVKEINQDLVRKGVRPKI